MPMRILRRTSSLPGVSSSCGLQWRQRVIWWRRDPLSHRSDTVSYRVSPVWAYRGRSERIWQPVAAEHAGECAGMDTEERRRLAFMATGLV